MYVTFLYFCQCAIQKKNSGIRHGSLLYVEKKDEEIMTSHWQKKKYTRNVPRIFFSGSSLIEGGKIVDPL